VSGEHNIWSNQHGGFVVSPFRRPNSYGNEVGVEAEGTQAQQQYIAQIFRKPCNSALMRHVSVSQRQRVLSTRTAWASGMGMLSLSGELDLSLERGVRPVLI
jgi:hypothetical protein